MILIKLNGKYFTWNHGLANKNLYTRNQITKCAQITTEIPITTEIWPSLVSGEQMSIVLQHIM